MKAFFVKDIYALKESRVLIFLMLVIVIGVSAIGKTESAGFIAAYVTAISSALVLNTISYDELDNGYSFLMTLPASRFSYVAEKYIFALCVGLAGGLVVMVCSGEKQPIIYISCLFSILFLQAVLIPVMLRFGIQKGRVVMIFLFVLCFGGISFLEDYTGLETVSVGMQELSAAALYLAGPGAAAVCMIVSFFCSVRIMQKKEF